MKPEIHIKEVAANLTLNVKLKGMKQFHWRLRIVYLLMKLAAWVGWYSIEIEDRRNNEIKEHAKENYKSDKEQTKRA